MSHRENKVDLFTKNVIDWFGEANFKQCWNVQDHDGRKDIVVIHFLMTKNINRIHENPKETNHKYVTLVVNGFH